MGGRELCVALLLTLAVSSALKRGVPRDATELIQVQALESAAPQDVHGMDAMIKSAMKDEMSTELGELSSDKQQHVAMQQTLSKIQAKKAVAEEVALEQTKDCKVATWTKWSKCSKECGGGTMKRSRKVLRFASNGGEACPDYHGLHESSSCNVESCADEKANLENKRRHLTEEEKSKEDEANNEILNRAKTAPTADRLKMEIRHWINQNVKTQMVHVLLPGEAPPSDEDVIQPLLKKAIAKNTISHAMTGFKATEANKTNPAKQSSAP